MPLRSHLRSLPRGVYAILNHPSDTTPAPEARLQAWADAGVRFVQLRTKGSEHSERMRLVQRLGPLAESLGVALVINDDIEAAMAPTAGIWGLHLGHEDYLASQEDPSARAALDELRRRGRGLGLSTHSLTQVSAAALIEPDYIGFGPVFPTHSKSDTAPVTGVEALGRACREYLGPVVAIGGVNEERLDEIRAAGAAAVAAISALEATTTMACCAKARALLRAWGCDS